MRQWIIEGNRELSGKIVVGGAKNSLLAILPATIVTKSVIELENVTPMRDTYVMIEILKKLNVRVIYDNKSKMIVDSRNVKNIKLIDEDMTKIRASYYFMGALMALYKNVSVRGPGGCKFANRPIDLHLFAFEKLGYTCSNQEEGIYNFAKEKGREKVIEFKKISVGATVNALLASCRIRGKIRLVNVAIEPEIDDLICFLNKCGANVVRENREIIVTGVGDLKGCNHKIIEDRIEAGTYLILGACLGNNLKVVYQNIGHLSSLLGCLSQLGVKMKIVDDGIIVNKSTILKDSRICFDVYPFIATDLQQPLSILLTKTAQQSVLKDKIYPSRYTQIKDLLMMGFKMRVFKGCLYIDRSIDLVAGNVECKDLRGGVSLVIAGLMAKGITRISNVTHIERGYFDIINKLRRIGARIYEEN